MNTENISFVRGDSFENIARQFYDKDDNLLILNPSTDELNFTVRKNVEEEVVIHKDLNNGIIEEDGTYIIILNPSDTEKLEFGRYGYDIELTIGKNEENPFVRTVESGTIELTKYDYSQHGGDTNEEGY